MTSRKVGDYSHRAPDALAVLKTEDGGATWSLWAVPDAGEVRAPVGTWQTVHFIDEDLGFLQVGGSTGATKLFNTEDGGRSWRAIAGSAGGKIAFADPDGIEAVALTLDGARVDGLAFDAPDQTDDRDDDRGFVERCCEEAFAALESGVDALVAEVPAAIARYRTLNLVVAGLQQVAGLRGFADPPPLLDGAPAAAAPPGGLIPDESRNEATAQEGAAETDEDRSRDRLERFPARSCTSAEFCGFPLPSVSG